MRALAAIAATAAAVAAATLAVAPGDGTPHSVGAPAVGAGARPVSQGSFGGAPPSSPAVGDVLFTSSGHWSGSPTGFAYAWKACDTNGANCTTAAGSPTNTPRYVIDTGDIGSTLRSQVTASFSGHPDSTVTSPPTGVVAAPAGTAPASTVGPYFTASTGDTSSCSDGCAIVGQSLAVSNGSWDNAPSTFSYQWDRCTTSSAQPPTTASCSAISGATASAYTVQSADVDHALVPIVTATNAAGSTSTTVSGSCNTGETLGATPAYTANVPTAQPAGCSPISATVNTTQAGEKFCTNAVTTCGYADPLNHTAGVPANVTPSTSGACASYVSGANLTSGTITINGCQINGQVTVNGANVTITNSDIAHNNEDGGSPGAVLRSGSLTVSHSTIHGLDSTTAGSLAWGIYARSGSPAITVDHVFFYNGDRILMNDAGSGQTSTVTDSYCWHNAEVVSSGSTEHYECVYTQSPASISVIGSVFYNLWSQTAANYADDNTGSGTATVDVEKSMLSGGGYCAYGGGGSGLFTSDTYLSNRFTRVLYSTCGQFGPSTHTAASVTASGNVWDDTGATVSP